MIGNACADSSVHMTLRSAATGGTLQILAAHSARLHQLHDLVRRQIGNSPDSYQPVLHNIPLNNKSSIGEQGVVGGSIIEFFSLMSAVPF